MKKPQPKPAFAPASSTPFLLGSLFLSGAACLVLELAGSRLISPFYGSSIYTWSAMITVTMVANPNILNPATGVPGLQIPATVTGSLQITDTSGNNWDIAGSPDKILN